MQKGWNCSTLTVSPFHVRVEKYIVFLLNRLGVIESMAVCKDLEPTYVNSIVVAELIGIK